jgi:hypothetical protein
MANGSEISGSTPLLRGLIAGWIKTPADKDGRRVSTAAFKYSDGVSVDRGDFCDPKQTIVRRGGLVAVSSCLCEVPSNCRLVVESDPIPENDAHCVIRGPIGPRAALTIAQASQIVLEQSSDKSY